MCKDTMLSDSRRIGDLAAQEGLMVAQMQDCNFIMRMYGSFETEEYFFMCCEWAPCDFFQLMTDFFGTYRYFCNVKIYAAQRGGNNNKGGRPVKGRVSGVVCTLRVGAACAPFLRRLQHSAESKKREICYALGNIEGCVPARAALRVSLTSNRSNRCDPNNGRPNRTDLSPPPHTTRRTRLVPPHTSTHPLEHLLAKHDAFLRHAYCCYAGVAGVGARAHAR
eukprot:9468396-Pyramimonas_sp.AAC.1